MVNPILEILNRNKATSSMPMPSNPNELFNNLIQTNPQFAKFVDENKHRTPEEIAKAYGVNPTILKHL